MALVKCKVCVNEISNSSDICPKCGKLLKNKDKKLSIVIIIVIFIAAFISFVKSKDPGVKIEDATNVNVNSEKISVASSNNVDSEESKNNVPALVENWILGSVKDEMTDSERPYVATYSLNTVEFKFPYHVPGGSRATLVIRKDPKRKVAYVMIDKGHMICSYNNCTIQTRSDSGKIKSWQASEAAPGVNNALFIENISSFESYINKNKKIRIGVEFYEYGIKSFDFDVSGYPGVTKK